MGKKGELVFDEMIPWIITLGALVLVIVLYIVLKGKGDGMLEYFRNLWRFGG